MAEPAKRHGAGAPGIAADPRMRYWRPAAELAPLVSGYHLYAVQPAIGQRHRDVFQPAWPSLRFTFGEDVRWTVRQPGARWQPVGNCSLFGPSSRVTWSECAAGLTIGIGLRPCGWLRFTSAKASDWADRVGEPADILRFDHIALRGGLMQLCEDDAIPALFDAFLCKNLGRPEEGEEIVADVEAALLDSDLPTVAALATRIGTSLRTLERLSLRAFGFAPKLLMRRARFLRSFHAVAEAPVSQRAVAIDPSYSDYSHFVRDAQHFLGMSPQAFLKLDTPLLKQSLVLRRAVLGAPAQALAGTAEG